MTSINLLNYKSIKYKEDNWSFPSKRGMPDRARPGPDGGSKNHHFWLMKIHPKYQLDWDGWMTINGLKNAQHLWRTGNQVRQGVFGQLGIGQQRGWNQTYLIPNTQHANQSSIFEIIQIFQTFLWIVVIKYPNFWLIVFEMCCNYSF